MRIVRVLSTFGVGDDARVAADINNLLKAKAKGTDRIHILSLSFSAYTEDDKPPMALADAIGDFVDRGGVVVASAGNDASCRISWPAALPDVVSVAALGPNGPAWFTNYGNWVRASAPGLDVVSRFFQHRDTTAKGMPAIERYAGWGSWSGTSFSAPIVAAVIARAVSRDGLEPQDAVRRYIDDPRLMRLPGLGTIINVH